MTKSVIGLDIGSYSIKAVALQTNKERLTLQGYAQARIGSQDPAVVIRKVINELGVRPRRLITSVSGRSVIVRQVETPKLGQDELKAHIAYEADKYIPFGADEVIIDCQPLPDRDGAKANNMQVLLVAVRRGFVEDHVNMLRSAGIMSEIIDVDVFALANAYEMLGPGAIEGATGATALIDIGSSKSNIAIVHQNRLLFTREVYLAGNEITDAIVRTFNEPAEDIERIKGTPGDALEALIDAAMPAFEDLANEIRISFDYVEGQFDQQVSNVVLSGGSAQLPGISSILGNILSRPVHVFDPLAGMDLVPSRYDIHGLDGNAPSLTVALGLAAHLIGSGFQGLGGPQSLGWQPRGEKGVAPRSVGGASGSSAPAVAPQPQRAAEATAVTMAPQPPPRIDTPLMPPPIMAPPPRMLTPAPMSIEPPVAPQTTSVRRREDEAANKSGLLVVLDDDMEMPPSEVPVKGTSTTARKSSIRVEGFDDDGSQGSAKLPELPKL